MASVDVEKPPVVDTEEESPIEEVRLTVSNTDDPSLPVWTFRMWTLGLFSCVLLSFLNQFFGYRSQPLSVSQLTVQVASLPLGHFMAKVLPTNKFWVPLIGDCSLNPGPFNMKEHVLISIFANAGYAFGNGTAYAVGIVDIIRVFYHRQISFIAAWLLIITTQVLGYGWAGLMRAYVVEPAHMWWPSTLVQVSLFRALHDKEKPQGQMSRGKFFIIALICSFTWYVVPGYLFNTLTAISWICYAFPNSVTAQQIGSGMEGLGLGAFSLDWSAVSAFLGSPLTSPFFAIVNVLVGYIVIVYGVTPLSYWGLNLFHAKTFPLFSSHTYAPTGLRYNTTAIVNHKFQLDEAAYQQQGLVNVATFFAVSYGIGFAAVTATLTHVFCFHGREILDRFRASVKGKDDVHTKLMRKYKDIPSWWFYILLVVSVIVSLILCTVLNDQVQLQWWGLLFACAMAFIFTLPISIITATTNQTPGLNVITEYVMGLIQPGKPIANVCFKVYGYMSMSQAVSFLADFKLGHYMKIPPRSMFIVQFVGTMVAGTVNLAVAWWLLGSVENICRPDLLPPNSPWTCPGDGVFFTASVLSGLVGPRRIFGPLGNYNALNWFFLVGAIGPVLVWLLHKAFPRHSWIPLINLPVLLGATAAMPPASTVNYNVWILVGIVFNFFIFRYRKKWWQRYNYVLSAALDAGVAFMAVLLFFALGNQNKSIDWWGNGGEHCPLASCPTAKGVVVDGCPLF